MKAQMLREKLSQLGAADRFDIIYGPQKSMIEQLLGCRILTLPLERIDRLDRRLTYFLVTDTRQGNSYLAVFEPVGYLVHES